MRFVALDFETTGVLPGHPNEPWQLGIVSLELEGGALPETAREWFFNIPPDRPFSPRAPGRWAEMRGALAASPPFLESWPDVHDALAGAPLVAHNAATERTILEKRAPLARFGPWVDTLRLVRKYWPILKSYALGDLVVLFGLKPQVDALCPGRAWHDALYDACAGAVLLVHVARILKFDAPQLLAEFGAAPW